MCGIVGIVGNKEVAPFLLSALKRLEYRGYDSAGIAALNNGKIEYCRSKGKISALKDKVAQYPVAGTVGIAHTRWATHGVPSEANAHPQFSDTVALVHNGIIENYEALKAEFSAKGYNFTSETDTEVIVALITFNLKEGLKPKEAVYQSIQRLEGSFAIEVLFDGYPDMIIGARRGSPLAVGYGDDEMFIGSDALALAEFTTKISYLEDGDLVVLHKDKVEFFDEKGNPVQREIVANHASSFTIEKGEFRHFMIKEIFEQPKAIEDTFCSVYDKETGLINSANIPFDLTKVSRVAIIACGTSLHAAMVAKYWIETYAKVPVDIDSSSEFRYRNPVLDKDTLAVFVSQSGETADTLAALRYCKKHGIKTLGMVNVPASTIAREADCILQTMAGPEVSVAATKAFTTQLVLFAALALALAEKRETLPLPEIKKMAKMLLDIPSIMQDFLKETESIDKIAKDIVKDAVNALYIGRGSSYPIALEGALKLKETSYIHAEGYSAGEMKHGPIALVDQGLPIIVVAPFDKYFEKTFSNMQEIVARGGKVIFVSNKKGIAAASKHITASIAMPDVNTFVAPILYSLPMQILAYYTALAKGTDMDQPRNLAKSVTVE